jgi:Immunity protein 10
MKFTALYIEPRTDEYNANLLFADPETNPDEPAVLSFSRSIETPDSVYYFEINDQSYGSYGGLEQVHLSRNQRVIRVTPDLVDEFGVEDFAEVQVEFEVDDEMYQSIENTLKVIFAGEEVFVVE